MQLGSASGSSSSSSVGTTSSSWRRMSGLVSGLDTDTLVQKLTSGIQSKIDKQKQNKQVAQWQQQSYREVTKGLSEFKTKYFSTFSSSSSILNSAFFSASSIQNNSPYLNISGPVATAKNMVISGISSLAKQASTIYNNVASRQALTSGAIQENWTKSTISNAPVTINYGGTDYSLYLGNSFSFNKGDAVSKLTDALNKGIAQTDGLKGNVQFVVNSDNTISLSNSIEGSTGKSFSIKSGGSGLLSGLGLTANTSSDASGKITGTAPANTNYFFNSTIPSGSSLEFSDGTNTYTLRLSGTTSLPVEPAEPADSASQTEKDAYNALMTTYHEETARVMTASLQAAINGNADLKGKLSASIDASGAVSFSGFDGLKVSGGSQNLLQGLGLMVGSDYSTPGMLNRDLLTQSYLGDSLAGSTLTFSLNGLTKNITFDENKKNDYSTPAGLQRYLQEKMKSAYGDGKVTVALSNGALSFTTPSDPTSVLTLTSSTASGVLGANGALRIYAGDSNRLNLSKSLEDLAPSLNSLNASLNPLTPGEKYKISVNGKSFEFSASDSVSKILNTINNDADANVTISYSGVTDKFSVAAKDGGASGTIDIQDVSGNLAAALFGTNSTSQTGTDASMKISFDGGVTFQPITRSSNSFTLDGVTIDLLKADPAAATVNAGNPITFSVSNNTDDLVKKIQDFVTDYNNIVSLAYGKVTQSKKTDGQTYAPLTDAQKKEMSESQITAWETNAKKGILQNDSLLYNLTLNMRSAVMNQVASVSSSLYQFGISTKQEKATDYGATNGQLSIDVDQLKAAITSNPDKLASLFTGSDGIATKLQDIINANIDTSVASPGILVQKAGSDSSTVDQSTLGRSMQDYDGQIKALKTRLENQQEYYYNKFSKLEQYMSQMNSQSSFFNSNSSQQ